METWLIPAGGVVLVALAWLVHRSRRVRRGAEASGSESYADSISSGPGTECGDAGGDGGGCGGGDGGGGGD